jgi:hypothetical protein
VSKVIENVPLINKRKKSIPSTHEMFIMKYLDNKGVKYEREYYNETLFNPKTDSLLFIDFYIAETKQAIEFDGSHHYSVSKRKGQKYLDDQIFRDQVKEQWCKNNGIELLRIRSFKYNEIKGVIDSFLKGEKDYDVKSLIKSDYTILNHNLICALGSIEYAIILAYIIHIHNTFKYANKLGLNGSFPIDIKNIGLKFKLTTEKVFKTMLLLKIKGYFELSGEGNKKQVILNINQVNSEIY